MSKNTASGWRARILAIVENHPALQAIGRGETPDDLLLLDLERTLQQRAGRERAGADAAKYPPGVWRAGGELPGLSAPGISLGCHSGLPRDRPTPIPAVHRRPSVQRQPDPLPARGAKRLLAETPPGFAGFV